MQIWLSFKILIVDFDWRIIIIFKLSNFIIIIIIILIFFFWSVC